MLMKILNENLREEFDLEDDFVEQEPVDLLHELLQLACGVDGPQVCQKVSAY